MVGFNEDQEKPLSSSQTVFAGAVSGACARCVCQPLDVIKIRLQLQLEPISKLYQSAKYHGMRHALQSIVKEESWKALWKGHVPAQLLSISYGAAQFLSFELLTFLSWQYFRSSQQKHLQPVVHSVCGGIAGCTATIVSFPFDLVRTRLVAQHEGRKVYAGVNNAFVQIIRWDGPKGLYRGISPTLVQIAPYVAAQFGFYNLFQQLFHYIRNSPEGSNSIMINFLSGSCSGLCAKSVVYPLDLCKKRLQVQGFQDARQNFGKFGEYTGFVDCMRSIFREEGIKGYYKGIAPSLFKAVVVTGLHFAIYDQIGYYFRTNSPRNRLSHPD